MSLKNSIDKLKRELRNLEASGHNISSKAYKDRKKQLQIKESMLKLKLKKGKRSTIRKNNSQINELEPFLKRENTRPAEIISKTRGMLNKAKKRQQKLTKLFNNSKQRTNALSQSLIPFEKNECECKTVQRVGNVNVTNNTCYCNVERNHQTHIKNKKGKKSRISKLFNFFKRSNNSGLGKGKSKNTKKGKGKSK